MNYKKAITNYGIAQPLVLCLLIIGVAGGVAFYISSKLSDKKAAYKRFEQSNKKLDELKNQTSENLSDLERLRSVIRGNARNTMEEQYNIAASTARSPQLKRTRNNPASRPAPIALAMEGQNSETYDLAFRGAYRDVQAMLVDFEYRLPNLFLENMSIEPDRGSETDAIFNLTYTVWKP